MRVRSMTKPQQNTVASLLTGVAVIEVAASLIIGFASWGPYDAQKMTAVLWVVAGLLSALMLIGFAEIIKQLSAIRWNTMSEQQRHEETSATGIIMNHRD